MHIATEKSVSPKGHKYVIDTVSVTKIHRLVIDTAGYIDPYWKPQVCLVMTPSGNVMQGHLSMHQSLPLKSGNNFNTHMSGPYR